MLARRKNKKEMVDLLTRMRQEVNKPEGQVNKYIALLKSHLVDRKMGLDEFLAKHKELVREEEDSFYLR